MKKALIIMLIVLAKSTDINAQFQILCSKQNASIKIENPNDIPAINNNGDGTVT